MDDTRSDTPFKPEGFSPDQVAPRAEVGPEASASQPVGRRRMRGKAQAVALGALLVGGAGGAAVVGPLSASAASPAASASTAPWTSNGGPGMGHTEAVSDTSVLA